MKNAVESITSLDFLQGNVYAILANLFTLKIRDVIRLIYILDNSSKKNYGLGFKGSPSRKKKLFNNDGILCHCRSKEGHFNFGPKWITRKIPLSVHAIIIMHARIDRDDHGRSAAEWNTLKKYHMITMTQIWLPILTLNHRSCKIVVILYLYLATNQTEVCVVHVASCT